MYWWEKGSDCGIWCDGHLIDDSMLNQAIIFEYDNGDECWKSYATNMWWLCREHFIVWVFKMIAVLDI